MVHEDFYVHDNPWDAATQTRIKRPGLGFLLCIGCFEKRLCRRLNRTDFRDTMFPPLNGYLTSLGMGGKSLAC
jgi:hypothetical protein